jgi:hypothetical protein
MLLDVPTLVRVTQNENYFVIQCNQKREETGYMEP